MNKLEAIKAFCLVVEHQSFSLAAKHIKLSATMVSRLVKQLEQQLGCLLLKRNTRKVYLTDAGRQYYDQMSPLLAQFVEVEQQMEQFNDNAHGKLTISASLEFGSQYLAPLIAYYKEQYPKVDLDFTLTNTTIDIFDHNVDIAFRVAPALPNASYIAQKIGHSKLALWAHPAYLKAAGTPKLLDDLMYHKLLFFNHGLRDNQWIFDDNGQQILMKYPWSWRSDNGRLLNEAAAGKQGIIQAPSYSVYQYVQRGELVEVMPKYSIKALSIFLVYSHRYALSNRIKAFVELAKEYFGKNMIP